MLGTSILNLIIQYKYPLLIPIGFAEGHIVSLVSGFLARMGYLNPFLAGACIAIGNLLGDVALYWLGFHHGKKFVKRWGKYAGLTETSVEKAHHIFHKHKSRILLISKMTNGFGLAMAILFSAGTVRIPFKTYMFWNVIGECLWTGGLVSVGFFFGHLYVTIDNIIARIGLIAILGVILLVVFFRIKKYVKRKISL